MESKVKEYQELYEEFEELYEQVSKIEEPIYDIESEIQTLKDKQKNVDYNNPDVMIGYMETYIDESIEKEKNNIQNDVNERMAEITNAGQQVKKNFDKAIKLLSRTKVDKYLHSANVDFEQCINGVEAEEATQFTMFSVLNTVLAFAFRFDFLRFFPKVIRIIIGFIFWSILLIPMILTREYNQFKLIYNEKLAGLSGYDYEVLGNQIAKDFLTSCVTSVIATVVVIVAINIIIYVLARYCAKKFLADNKVACLAIIDSDGLKQKMYDAGIARYMERTVTDWKQEIELVRKTGQCENINSSSLIGLVKSDLYEKYNSLEIKICSCNSRIEEIRKQGEETNIRLQTIISKLKEKEKEVESLIADSNHNNAVLSPYVSAGYSQHTIEGVKELIYFKHNYKPILICYGDDTEKDGERFRKNSAKIIELFMRGFFQENYHAYINMWLVDFEGLYFPESRTKGLMKVVRTQQDVQQMFGELKATRENIDSLEDGRISTINQTRLADRENPIKYNIVYFIGYDFSSADRELSQLFIGGDNFGFLPIVFMRKSLAQSMLHDDGYSRAFSRVIEKMKDNDQIYEFEGLVSEFELDLMVSNQKRLLDEKLCVNKIMSMDEFIAVAESEEGLDIDDVLYLDTYQLSETIYEAIEDMDYVKLFTINGEVPGFVTKNVIKL